MEETGMNENFIDLVKNTGKSVYQISRETGIPYTTLSELINEKVDINKCAAGMVHKLTLYLKCSLEDILNREPLITNKSGTYRKIKYKWVPTGNGTVTLNIKDGPVKKIIDEGKCDQARFYPTFDNMTELVIDYYITQKEVDESL